LDRIRDDYPDRFLNVGSCEQLMIGAAVGLSYSGYTPICYSITPFLLYRPFEMIRNYVDHENLNIKLVGSGRDKDYDHDGFTHHAEDDLIVLKSLENIRMYKPGNLTPEVFGTFINSQYPSYLNLKRF
jgi:transketolase